MGAINAATSTELMLYNNAADSIVYTKVIDSSFGFVQYPKEDQIYFLTVPSSTSGFRLNELKLLGGQIQVTSMSTNDLEISNMSPYLQTIHSETNSYICRGGSNSIEAPSNFLYQIDLTTGELVNSAELEDSGIILSLSAE